MGCPMQHACGRRAVPIGVAAANASMWGIVPASVCVAAQRRRASAGSDSFWSFDIEEFDGLDRLDHDGLNGPAVRCRC